MALAAVGALAAAARPSAPAGACSIYCAQGELSLGVPTVELVEGDPEAPVPSFPTATLTFAGEDGWAELLKLDDQRLFVIDEEVTP